MKILAFSDLHRDVAAAEAIVASAQDADLIVGAGDFGTRGVGAADTIAVLRACGVPGVFVHGNHDDPKELKALCEGWDNGHYLHGGAATFQGTTFFGLGGAIPPRGDAIWNVTETEEAATQMLAACPRGAVLITHTPPFGSADVQKGGAHEGSDAIRAFIKSGQPCLNLCGHIHHAWGMTDVIGDTKVHNLGPVANWFNVS